MSIAQIAAKTTPTHGAIAGHSEMNVTGAGPGFGLHIVDVEVDRETGRVDIKRTPSAGDPARPSIPFQSKGRFQAAPSRALAGAPKRKISTGPEGGRRSPRFCQS